MNVKILEKYIPIYYDKIVTKPVSHFLKAPRKGHQE